MGPALALLLSAVLYGDPQVAFSLLDPRIAESSGLVSSAGGEVVYTHNDSGDEARFFAVGPDGRTRTTYVLPGVQARDWEDMARGPDEQGRSSLWLGDIGDNSASRDRGLLVHRVPEPALSERAQVVTSPPTSFRLRYPDGPGDAETLLVHPRTGRLHVVTKPLAGPALVYAAPEVLDPDGPNILELVGQATVRATGTPGGPGIGGLANLLVTAGDVSPDGRRVALRTYTDLYEWSVPDDGDLGAAFAGEPVVTPLPPTEQGEGLAYSTDGRSVLVSSEGAEAPVHRLAAGEPLAAVGTGPATEEPGAVAPRSSARDDLARALVPVLAAAALVALLVLLAAVRVLRRSRS